MAGRFIKNDAIFIGKIIDLFKTEKTTIITVDTRQQDEAFGNRPHIYCFGKTKEIVDKYYNIGDYARFNCLVQSNNGKASKRDVPSHSVVLFNITKVRADVEDFKTVNIVNLFGRIVSTRKINNHLAFGKIMVYTTRANYFDVRFVSDSEKDVDSFCMLLPNEPARFNGLIQTNKFTDADGNIHYQEWCTITRFRKAKTQKTE